MIGDRKVDIPSYIVTVEEENSVHFSPESKIPEMLEKTKKEEPVVEASEETSEDSEAPKEVAVEATTETPAEAPKEVAVEATTETPAEAPKDKTSSTE
jgi:small subunit ribosomal protein S4